MSIIIREYRGLAVSAPEKDFVAMMSYDEYAYQFTLEAKKHYKSDDYIKNNLEYAKNLMDKGLPVIYDSEHLSMLVGYTRGYIKHAIRYMEGYYWEYRIPKKSGGLRIIKEPMPNLKDIQLWILHHILYNLEYHPYAKAYIPKKSIRDNVRFHTKRKIVMTLDIHDFFGSIDLDSIYEIFHGMGYSYWIADLLSKLCCLNNSLPQGAPTSPALSNLYMFDFDQKMMSYCLGNHIFYTRYADDMTFSGDFDTLELKRIVASYLEPMRLSLNEEKCKIMKNTQRQIVTGCVVNQRTHLPVEQLKKIRQEIYYIKKFGLSNHLENIQCQKKNYIKHLYGRINYALLLQPSNKEMKEYKEFIHMNYRDQLLEFEV
jgi:RNA-directed DNA polymerase